MSHGNTIRLSHIELLPTVQSLLPYFYKHYFLRKTGQNAYEPRQEKPCLREAATRQDSNWPAQLHRIARALNFGLSKYRYYTINNGVDQTVQKRRLICAFVIDIRQVFSWRGSYVSLVLPKFSYLGLLKRSSSMPYQSPSRVIINKKNPLINNWARSYENVSYDICGQQRCRSACASSQSDQQFCCSLLW